MPYKCRSYVLTRGSSADRRSDHGRGYSSGRGARRKRQAKGEQRERGETDGRAEGERIAPGLCSHFLATPRGGELAAIYQTEFCLLFCATVSATDSGLCKLPNLRWYLGITLTPPALLVSSTPLLFPRKIFRMNTSPRSRALSSRGRTVFAVVFHRSFRSGLIRSDKCRRKTEITTRGESIRGRRCVRNDGIAKMHVRVYNRTGEMRTMN